MLLVLHTCRTSNCVRSWGIWFLTLNKAPLLGGAEEWRLLPWVTQEHLCDTEASSPELLPFSVWTTINVKVSVIKRLCILLCSKIFIFIFLLFPVSDLFFLILRDKRRCHAITENTEIESLAVFKKIFVIKNLLKDLILIIILVCKVVSPVFPKSLGKKNKNLF